MSVPRTPEHEPPPRQALITRSLPLLRRMQVLKKKLGLGWWRGNVYEVALAPHICNSRQSTRMAGEQSRDTLPLR